MKLKLIGVALAALMLIPVAQAAHSATITNKDSATPGTYTVEVDVENFRLVDFQGRDAKKGEGHIHYLVNGNDACSAGKADCSAATDYATTSKSFTFKNLEDGDVITVELVLSDHGPSGTDSNGNLNDKRVTDSVTVSSSNGTPGFGMIAGLAAIGAVAALMRRK